MRSAPWGGYPTVEAYFGAGGDVNAIDSASGWTLLHQAAEHADVNLMGVLIGRGADLSIRDFQGWMPLHLAVDGDIDGAIQNEQIPDFTGSRKLISLGAALDALTSDGLTPRDVAAAYGSGILDVFDKIVAEQGK